MRRLALCILIVILTPTLSFALSVNLIDSSYSYDIRSTINYPSSESAEGRITGHSGNPQLYRELRLATLRDDEFGYIGGYVSAEPFSLDAFSNSWTWDDTGERELMGSGHAFVSGSWIFNPTEFSDGLNIFADFNDSYSANYIILNDLTDNHEIFNGASLGFLGDGDPNYIETYLGDLWEGSLESTIDYNWDGNIDTLFLSDHVYELKLGAIAQSGGDFWDNSISADIQVASVPEPATGILLCMGTLFYSAWRWKRLKIFFASF